MSRSIARPPTAPTLTTLAVITLLATSAHATPGATSATFAGGGTPPSAAGLAGSAVDIANPVLAPTYVPGGEVSAFGFFLNQIAPPSSTLSYCVTPGPVTKSVYDMGGANLRCVRNELAAVAGRNGFGTQKAAADFAVSDGALKAAEFSTYLANAATIGSPIYGRGQPVQLPAVVSSVGVVYNNPDLTSRLNLGSQQLCQIFDGEITNWRDIDPSLPSRRIKVIVPKDPSSTTYAFTNYLNSVCTGLGETYGVSETYANALPNPLPQGASTATFVNAGSRADVTRLVKQRPGAIAFVDVPPALRELGGDMQLATVESLDPVANLPESAAYLSDFPLLADQAVGADVPNGRPELQPLTGGAKTGCVLLADPSATGFVAGGYPIVNVSYFLLASQGNGEQVTSLSRLGSFLAKADTFPAFNVSTPRVTTIDVASIEAGTGHIGIAALVPGSTAAAAVEAASLACVAP